MAKELECKGFLIRENGDIVPWSNISKEEKQQVFKNMQRRLSINMSAYYTQHMDEFERL